MRMRARGGRRQCAAWLVASAGAACVLQVSCASRPEGAEALRAQDFRSAGAAGVPAVAPAQQAGAAKATWLTDEEASEGMVSLEALVGAPPDAPGPGAQVLVPERAPAQGATDPGTPAVGADPTADVPGAAHAPVAHGAAPPPGSGAGAAQGQVIDSLVGQINGRPVYASEFFAPIEKRLVALAGTAPDPLIWTREARQIIGRHLAARVQDELILAEAQSSLTPQQRQGLLGFLQHLRGQLVSAAGGGEAAVDTELREKGEKGLDDKVRDVLQTELVRNELQTRVKARVNVSWRDVQLEYQKRHEEFNPPAEAVFRAIMVPDGSADVEGVSARLAAGEPFADVAASEANVFNRDNGGVLRTTFRGEFAAGEFFAPGLNEAARGLSPGQAAGPIPFAGKQAWIRLDSIERPPARSLYEVQQTLFSEIARRRFNDEAQRYLDRLLQKGSFSNLDMMTERLLAIASDRYMPARR